MKFLLSIFLGLSFFQGGARAQNTVQIPVIDEHTERVVIYKIDTPKLIEEEFERKQYWTAIIEIPMEIESNSTCMSKNEHYLIKQDRINRTLELLRICDEKATLTEVGSLMMASPKEITVRLRIHGGLKPVMAKGDFVRDANGALQFEGKEIQMTYKVFNKFQKDTFLAFDAKKNTETEKSSFSVKP